MLLAKIICSDPGCLEEHEVAVDRLIHLEGFACECGYGFVLASVAELSEPSAPSGEVVSIAKRRPARARAGRGSRAA